MFPDRTFEIQLHRESARKYLKDRNYDMARLSFFKWVESVRQQNINLSGDLAEELKAAQQEYCEFVIQDPLYLRICDLILYKIRESKGILQTDLYKIFPDIAKDDISYVLYFADIQGIIKRTKKGRTYELSTD